MTEMVNTAEFQSKVMESQLPVLVDFFATWCGPCRMMSSVIDEVAVAKTGTAKVYKLDIDESPEVAQNFGVMSVPTFIVFKGGMVYKSAVGAQPKEAILALFD